MTTNMTLTAEPDVAAVLIEITGAPAGPMTITRTDANGTAPVRLLPGQEPIGGSLTVRDYEAALFGSVQYETVGERTNAITNPSFETNTADWLANAGSSTLTRDTAKAQSGAASGRMDTTAGAVSPYVSTGTTLIAATPGKPWAGSAYLTGTGSGEVGVLYTDGTNTLATHLSGVVALTGAFQRLSCAAPVAPAGTTHVRLRVYQRTPASAQQLWLDAAMLEQTDQVRSYIAGTVTDTITATVTLDAAEPVLSAAVLPHLRQALALVTGYDSRRQNGGSVHYVEGREDAIVITKPMRLREGTVTLHASTFEQARAIEAIAAPGEVLLLRQPDNAGMDMYLIARSVGNRPRSENTSPKRWSVDIDYVEQRNPSGDLLSAAGWNFAEHTALGITFAQSLVLFPTFNDRVAGP